MKTSSEKTEGIGFARGSTTMTVKQAKRIGLSNLNWSEKLALAKKYSPDRLCNPPKFDPNKKSIPGGCNNLDQIVADLLA